MLQGFARGLGQSAPGLDVKCFILPYLPLQLLLLPLPEASDSDNITAAAKQHSALAAMHNSAVQELCDHTVADNVEGVATLLANLPAATLANAVLPVLKSDRQVRSSPDDESDVNVHDGLSSSTAYTACAAGTWYDMSGVSSQEQAEMCQQMLSYLPRMLPHHAIRLLLWGSLEQPHPLLPSGPKMASTALPEQLRLNILQPGLAQLKEQSIEQRDAAVETRLQMEAKRLAVICDLEESCNLSTPEQAIVKDSLFKLTTAGTAGDKSEAMEACIAALVHEGCSISDVLHVTSCMLSMLSSEQSSEQSSQESVKQIKTVLMARLDESLIAIAGTTASDATANGDGKMSWNQRHQQAQAAEDKQEQAADFIRGVLLSLQQPGTAGTAGSAGTAQQLVSSIRTEVWQRLQQHLLPSDTRTDSASLHALEMELLEVMLSLADSADGVDAEVTPGYAADAHLKGASQSAPRAGVTWQGWRGAEGGTQGVAQAQRVLLFSRSKALVQTGWSSAVVSSADVSSLEMAEKLFMRLLGGSEGAEQLELLQRLLADVWHNGQDFDADEVCDSCVGYLCNTFTTSSLLAVLVRIYQASCIVLHMFCRLACCVWLSGGAYIDAAL